MAEKIIIDIQLNDQASNKTLNDLKANLKNLKAEIGGVAVGSDAFNKLSAEIAKTNIQIKEINKGFTTIANDATHAADSINGMEATLKELKAQISTVGVGSKEFKDLQTQIIKVDTNLKNTKKSIEGLDVEALAGHIGKLGGGITASFTAVSAVIGKGNADIEKFTANIVSGIAVANGIKGATEAWSSAQKLLNIAMAANPIGVMIAGIAALTAGIAALVITMDDSTDEQLALNEAQKAADKIATDYKLAINQLDVQLANLTGTFEDVKKAEEKALNDKQAKEWGETVGAAYSKAAKGSKEYQDSLINESDLKDKQKQAIDGVEYKQKRYYAAVGEQQKEARLRELNYAKEKLAEINKEIKAEKDKRDEILKNDKEYQATIKGLSEQQAKERAVLAAKQVKDEKDKNDKIVELEKQNIEKLIELRKRLENVQNEVYEAGIELSHKQAKLAIDRFGGTINQQITLLEVQQAQELRLKRHTNEETIKGYEKELDSIKGNGAKAKAERKRIEDEISTIKAEFADNERKLQKFQISERIISEEQLIKKLYDLNDKLAKDVYTTNLELSKDEEGIAKNKVVIAFDNNVLLLNEERRAITESLNVKKLGLEAELKFAEQKQGLTGDEADQNEMLIVGLKKVIEIEGQLINKKLESIEKYKDANGDISEDNIKLLANTLGLKEEEVRRLVLLDKAYVAEEKKRNQELEKLTEEYLNKRTELQAKSDAEDLQRQITHLDKQAAIYEGDIARVADINKEKNDLILNQNINAIYKTQEEQFKALDKEAEAKLRTEEEVAAEKKRIEEDSLRAVDDLKAENRKKNKDLDIKVQEELAAHVLNLLSKVQEVQLNGVINRINTEYNAQVEAYQAQEEALAKSLDNSLITQSEYDAQLKLIEIEKQEADLKNRQRIAKAQQDAALVQIAIETAVAIAKAVQLGPAAPLQIALAVATGAAQAAVVKSQPIPTYSKGGILNGPSHENGGVPIYANGGQIAEAEGGEIILNKNVSKIPALTQLASMINVSTGGKSFMPNSSSISTNSALTATVDPMVIQSIVNSTVKGIASIPVQNVATQTTRVSRRVENVEASARY